MINREEILKLIYLKQEGPYWDFKRQWYEDGHEGDMLHDIICMANNLVNRDAYIIIGVDEEHDYSPYDISADPQTRNTQMVVDFLRAKKFAGDCRPVVTVEHIEVAEYKLDVIVIHNSMNTPFYLKAEYKGNHPNNIYVRTQDTNTPPNESADVQYIEQLWKKRFGLNLSPLQRMQVLLKDKNDWDNIPGSDDIKYYRYAPEYTIGWSFERSEFRTGYEYYFLNQTDHHPCWGNIQLKYFQTVLYETSGNVLDGGRHLSPAPDMTGISFSRYGGWDVSYRYWEKDSLDYAIHSFYFDINSAEARWSENKLLENVLVFESKEEHELFRFYVECHWCEKDVYRQDIREPYVPELPGYNVEHFKNEILTVRILQKMLEAFRIENARLLQAQRTDINERD